MVKREDTHSNVPLERGLQTMLSISAITLKVGKWRSLFTEQHFNILIAEALNKTLLDDAYEKTLIGYLITYRKVYLILKIKQTMLQKMLHFFYKAVKTALEQYVEKTAEAVTSDGFIQGEPLFEQLPLKNDHLIKLITGRKVKLPYYSPTLERLKEKIRNYNFCSAIDYSGAIGPVLVTLQKLK